MEEKERAEGLLSAEPPEKAGPGIDPLNAVRAVAEPRNERERAADAAGEAAETEESTGSDNEAAPHDGGDNGEYGEFAWPEGYHADEKVMAKFVPLAKKLGLSRESAQSLATLYAEIDRERNAAQAEFIAGNNRQWLREVEAHPEFGGANLQRTGESVASLMRRYGSPLLMAQIRQMNVQNWPEMFYFLARVSQAVSEDCSPGAGDARAAAKSTAQLLFPDMR